jgi:hypothetical protein
MAGLAAMTDYTAPDDADDTASPSRVLVHDPGKPGRKM